MTTDITSAMHPFNRASFLAESIGSRNDAISGTAAREIAAQILDDPFQASVVESYILLVESVVDRLETADQEPLGKVARDLADLVTDRDRKGWSQMARRNARILAETIKRGAERTA